MSDESKKVIDAVSAAMARGLDREAAIAVVAADPAMAEILVFYAIRKILADEWHRRTADPDGYILSEWEVRMLRPAKDGTEALAAAMAELDRISKR
jgi:hypothetical protein